MIRLPQTDTMQQLGEYLHRFCLSLSDRLASSRDTRVERMLGYIEEHYRSCEFSIYSMAEDLGISYSYMNRVFHLRTGQSVLDYLTDKRMELIKELLRTTDIPIKDLILSAGYNDIPNCSRKFKQREGISLGKYREKLRNH
jgi:two-component system response regulator YesN